MDDMDGVVAALASFNPWTLLDDEDPGDHIGKAKPKDDRANNPNVTTWLTNKAMNSSTPAKKKKDNKKKKPEAPSKTPANGNHGPAGKQNGTAPKANWSGASGGGRNNQSTARQGSYNNGGYYGEPMKEQQQPAGAAVEARRRPVEEPAPVPPVPTFGLWLEKSAKTKRAGAAGGATATDPAAENP
jgi:hypothetical protein